MMLDVDPTYNCWKTEVPDNSHLYYAASNGESSQYDSKEVFNP